MSAVVESVRDYWEAHPLGLQYVSDPNVEIGSPAFYEHIRPWMNPYKFPWIMERIESEAANLRGKKLLEIGCGMGYDSLEFLKRGVNVTAIDLTPAAIDFARRGARTKGTLRCRRDSGCYGAPSSILAIQRRDCSAVVRMGIRH